MLDTQNAQSIAAPGDLNAGSSWRSLRGRSNASHLLSVIQWAVAEEKALSEGGPQPDASPILRDWPHATLGADGGIALTLHSTHRPWIFDPAIAAFCRIAIVVRGSIGLNSVGGDGQDRRRLLFAYLGGPGSRKVPLDRITVDAKPGQSVRDPTGDYHDRRAAGLILDNDPQRGDAAGKFRQGRREAVGIALAGYDEEASKGRRLPLSRDTLEELLWFLLRLHDRRRLPLSPPGVTGGQA